MVIGNPRCCSHHLISLGQHSSSLSRLIRRLNHNRPHPRPPNHSSFAEPFDSFGGGWTPVGGSGAQTPPRTTRIQEAYSHAPLVIRARPPLHLLAFVQIAHSCNIHILPLDPLPLSPLSPLPLLLLLLVVGPSTSVSTTSPSP